MGKEIHNYFRKNLGELFCSDVDLKENAFSKKRTCVNFTVLKIVDFLK